MITGFSQIDRQTVGQKVPPNKKNSPKKHLTPKHTCLTIQEPTDGNNKNYVWMKIKYYNISIKAERKFI
jgi:hypothetical protein